MIKYTIKLTEEEVTELTSIIKRGKHSNQAIRAAYVLLNSDKGHFSRDVEKQVTNELLSNVLMIGTRTIDRIKKKFLDEGLQGVLERKKSKHTSSKKIDGDLEAKIVALCCSKPPTGYAKWSLRLLADKVVELNYIDKLSHVSISKTLKKMNLSLGE